MWGKCIIFAVVKNAYLYSNEYNMFFLRKESEAQACLANPDKGTSSKYQQEN